MNRFLMMPDKLYVLRMNEEGSDCGLEEPELVAYPDHDRLVKLLARADGRRIKAVELRAWGFGELVDEMHCAHDGGGGNILKRMADDDVVTLSSQFDYGADTLRSRLIAKRIALTLEKVGRERMVAYSLRRESVECEETQTRQSLCNYKEHVVYVWQRMNEYDSQHARRIEDKKNIDLCGVATFFYHRDRPLIKVGFRLGHTFRTDVIMTEYDIPTWRFEHLHQGTLSVGKGRELLHENRTFEEWIDEVFREPEEAETSKQAVVEVIKAEMGHEIMQEDVKYNPMTNSYFLKDEREKEVFSELMPVKNESIEEMAKYTTLDTLAAIMKSGKIRMNSIVSMNDKTEADFMEENIKNFKEEIEDEFDKYLFADKKFITSFTEKIDDLDMWRLYGDNARGVCLVFKRFKGIDDGLYNIKYVNPDGVEIGKVKAVLKALEERKVKFYLTRLDDYRHYLKHEDYATEQELRLLETTDEPSGWYENRDNGIMTPYLEKRLCKTGRPAKDDYPFRLERIIIGPAMREKEANFMQVFYMAHQYGFFIGVQTSKIGSYR